MVERSGTGWHTPGAIPDGNSAALDAEMRSQDEADRRHEELLARYPLDDFESEAWLHFYDPCYCAVSELVDEHPDAAAFALCMFAGLSRGYYAYKGYHPGCNVSKSHDAARIRAWIDAWIKTESERLQANKIEGEL